MRSTVPLVREAAGPICVREIRYVLCMMFRRALEGARRAATSPVEPGERERCRREASLPMDQLRRGRGAIGWSPRGRKVRSDAQPAMRKTAKRLNLVSIHALEM